MNVSLAMLRRQLYAMRSWDSSGETQDKRIRDSLNVALDRMANDVPQALLPDEETVVLYPDVVSTDDTVKARVLTADSDKRLLQFVNYAGNNLLSPGSDTTWNPRDTGEWDGIMHIEITDAKDQIHRRQCVEFFSQLVKPDQTDSSTWYRAYFVTIDRPYISLITIDNNATTQGLAFRLHQPEFFVDDDVTDLMEPARIFDGTRQQVWKIDTAGASRQDMLDYQGNSKGRPFRCWRGRHFQLRAPTEPPRAMEVDADQTQTEGTSENEVYSDILSTASAAAASGGGKDPLPDVYKWTDLKGLRRGTWAICYTYVWGRKNEDWRQSPMVTPGGDIEQNSSYGLTWAYKKGTITTGENNYSGIHDPQFESAPSPVTVFKQSTSGQSSALVISATNIDQMLGFGDDADVRFGRSGLRIRYYVAHLEANEKGRGTYNAVETNQRFHLLCEVEPTYDMCEKVESDTSIAAAMPKAISDLGNNDKPAARIIWTGKELYDYHRTLKHSTGYYAWKVFPHQDARYELDFRVSRLPKKYINDQDTAPIHPEAVPTLLELALYYISLVDGNDQVSAQAHLNRYMDLVRVFRDRYGNPGGIVEPVPILGYAGRHRYGKFGSTPLED